MKTMTMILTLAFGLFMATASFAQAPAAAPAAMATTTAPAKAAPAREAAPGGGPGKVWVNKTSKAYHCSTDRWYGKTKNGEYMTEAAAKAAGYKHKGAACQ